MRDESSTLSLKGIREDILRDFLAALGLLDWASAIFSEYRPRLSWNELSGHPILHSSAQLPENWASQILEAIRGWRNLNPNPFSLGKVEAIPSEALRGLMESSIPRLSRFYCGLASQLSHDGAGRRSELIIESANRSVLKGVDDLLTDTKRPIDLHLDLNGSGAKREVSNTSRWHPAEYQPAAYVATDPKNNKHHDCIGLNILALFGTSFFPVVDSKRGRETAGFKRANQINEFAWPVWSEALAIDEVRALVIHPFCHAKPEPRTLAAFGIHRVWRCRKFQPDGKNDYFSSASPG